MILKVQQRLITFVVIFMCRFLYKSSQCLASCPIGTYQGDSIIRECFDCPANCLRCTNNGQKCEDCSMDHFLVADLRTCVKSCGEGMCFFFNAYTALCAHNASFQHPYNVHNVGTLLYER